MEGREAALLQEISVLYEQLEDIRQAKRNETNQDTESSGKKNQQLGHRVLVVTRKLPFRLGPRGEDGKYTAEGVEIDLLDETVQQLTNLHQNYGCIWIGGGLGGDIDSSEQSAVKEELLQTHNYFPVFLNDKKEHLFYEGFCKNVMHPLFHSSPPTTEDQILSHESSVDDYAEEEVNIEKTWNAYVSVNQAYADAIQELYQEGDILWIQDYPFALLPQMVRNLLPNAPIRIGFFLHIPFPSSELYRVLKYREEILNGMLGSDLIGFQTYEYARHFQSSAVRILGLESNHKGISQSNNGHQHFVRIAICPIGIDPMRYHTLVASDSVQNCIRDLENRFYGKKIVLGVNRLDSTSGLVHKFLAINELLTTTPELARELVFVEIVLSETSSSFASGKNEKLVLESQVDAMVSRINSIHVSDIGSAGSGGVPIQYITREVPLDELVALYCVADLLITSPIRDGMNVVPFEYVVCRDAHGSEATVVLSEFAGSATSLGGAFLINPWNTEDFAATILEALDEDEDDVLESHQHMYQYVSTFTSDRWASVFLEQLAEESAYDTPSSGREVNSRDVSSTYSRSRKRLLFLNYEGVLANDASIPELSRPSEELMEYLSLITSDPSNTVIIVSARSAAVMEKWFGNIPAILAAEYGVYIRWSLSHPWKCVRPNLDLEWWEHVMPLLEYYTERTPGSFIERKESAITWHYRGCDLDHGFWQSTELQITLREVTRTMPISVIPGVKNVEIRPRTISKAALFERIWEFLATYHDKDLAEDEVAEILANPVSPKYSTSSAKDDDSEKPFSENFDFVFVVAPGTDRTDEDLFSILIPPRIDLMEYCAQLALEEEEEESPIKSNTTTSSMHRSLDLSEESQDDPIDVLLTPVKNRMMLTPAQEGAAVGAAVAGGIPSSSSSGSKQRKFLNDEPIISKDAAERFPSELLGDNSSVARRSHIKEKSKFTPRKDFPPSVALFKAMRRKYGVNFGMQKLPDTAAACWALVLPPNSRGIVGDELNRNGTGANASRNFFDESSPPDELLVTTRSSSSPTPTVETSVSDDDANAVSLEETEEKLPSFYDRADFPLNTFVCTIGRKLSQAPFFIKDTRDMASLLSEMASISRQSQTDQQAQEDSSS